MNFFKWIGAVLATVVALGAGYEAIALWTGSHWPPTFSNLVQGLRDSGHKKLVFLIAIVAGFVLMAFAQWLYYHFVFEARTAN